VGVILKAHRHGRALAAPYEESSESTAAVRAVTLKATPLGFGMEFGDDCAVVSVKLDSQARRSGIHAGDAVITVDGVSIGSPAALTEALEQVPIGSTVELGVAAKAGAAEASAKDVILSAHSV